MAAAMSGAATATRVAGAAWLGEGASTAPTDAMAAGSEACVSAGVKTGVPVRPGAVDVPGVAGAAAKTPQPANSRPVKTSPGQAAKRKRLTAKVPKPAVF